MTTWEWIGAGVLALFVFWVIGLVAGKFMKMDYNEHAYWGARYGNSVMEIQNEITFLLPEDENEKPVLDPKFQADAIARLRRMHKNWSDTRPPDDRQRVHDLLLKLINSTMRELHSGLTDKDAQRESEYLMSALHGELDRLAKRHGL